MRAAVVAALTAGALATGARALAEREFVKRTAFREGVTVPLEGTDGFGADLLKTTPPDIAKRIAPAMGLSSESSFKDMHHEMLALSQMLDAGGDAAAAAIDMLGSKGAGPQGASGHEQLREDEVGRKLEAKANAAMLRKLSTFYYDHLDPKKCRPEAGQAALEIANKHNPNDASGHWMLGAALAAQRNWRDATTHFRLAEHIRIHALSRKPGDDEGDDDSTQRLTSCDARWANVVNWPASAFGASNPNATSPSASGGDGDVWPRHMHANIVHRDDAATIDAMFAANGTHWQVVDSKGDVAAAANDDSPRYSPTDTVEVVFRGDVFVREHNGIVYDGMCHVYTSPLENLLGLQRGYEFFSGHGHDDYFDDCQSIALDAPVLHALNGLSENYYHFLGESVPQLVHMLASAAAESAHTGTPEPMILAARHPHVEQLMTLLGIVEERVLYYSDPRKTNEEEESSATSDDEGEDDEPPPPGTCLHFPGGIRLVDIVQQRRVRDIPLSSHYVRSFRKTCVADTPANAAEEKDLYYYVDGEDISGGGGRKKRREYLLSGRSPVHAIGAHPAATLRVMPPALLQRTRAALWHGLDHHVIPADASGAEVLLVTRKPGSDGVRSLVGGEFLEELLRRTVARVYEGADVPLPKVRAVDPGTLSVAEQGAAFRAAKLVVAPHGAALTNLIFASPNTTVLVLPLCDDEACPAAPNQYYTHLSTSLGLRMLMFKELWADFFSEFRVTKQNVRPLLMHATSALMAMRSLAQEEKVCTA